MTYPTEAVAKFVDYNFIPVQIQVSNTALMQKYGVSWTPTILVLDADGKEHYRTVGFLAPQLRGEPAFEEMRRKLGLP